MLSLLLKKKVCEDKASNFFVNSLLNMVDSGFSDIAEIINCDSQFVTPPQINSKHSSIFLQIMVAGNLKLMAKYFKFEEERKIYRLVIEKFARVFEMPPDTFEEVIKEIHSLMSKANYPSKNTLYAMSKAVFYKFELGPYQKDYFKNLNIPDPIFLKHVDEIVINFVLDWKVFGEKYRLQNLND